MPNFKAKQSITDFQDFISTVYSLPDDQLFSLSELVDNMERFTMRALKGIRKANIGKLQENLLISFSWCMAVCNRLHLNIEKALWRRFPMQCSYCGKLPCACKKEKIIERVKITRKSTLRPNSLAGFQQMFAQIYPSKDRSLADAGVHLAEECGEVSEAVLCFLGQHTKRHFLGLEDELADYLSCIFGVANSADILLAEELEKFYCNNCHVCHLAPCQCNFTLISEFKS